MPNENIIKEVCRKYNLSYSELAHEVGSTQSTVSTSASTGKVSKPLERSIQLYIENQKLKEEAEEFHEFKQIITKMFPNLQK